MPYLVGYITPQDYGALGDGVNDDTAEIQAALNAANASGSTVFFPSGTYLISASLTVNNTGTIIMGNGWGSQILYDGSVVTAGAINAAATKRVFIRDIRISQTNASHLGTAIDASNFFSGVIERVLIDGGGASGVAPLIGVQMNASTCHHNVVRECRISYGGASSRGVSIIASSHSNTVQDIRFTPQSDNVNSAGVYITNSHSTTLIHPDVESATGNGIFLDTAAHSTTIVSAYCDTNAINLKIASGVIGLMVAGGTYNGGTTTNIQDNGAVSPIILNAWPNSGTTTFSRASLSAASAGGQVLSVVNTTGTPTSDNFNVTSQSAADAAFGLLVSGDTVDRLAIDSNGKHQWGPGGATALDTVAGRAGVGVLYTSKNFLVGAAAALGDNGVGELQIANAATPPTTNPTAGVSVYAVSGAAVPLRMRDVAGNVRGLSPAFSISGADQPSVGTAQTASNSLIIAVEANATYVVRAYVYWTTSASATVTTSWTTTATSSTMIWNDTTGGGDVVTTLAGVSPSWTTGSKMIELFGILVTSATPGNLVFTFASSVSASMIVKATSTITAERIK